MRNLYFEDFLDFACAIADKFDELDKENFEDIAVIAKPNEIKEIFKELICIGYDICNITYERIDWDGYDDEYVLSMNHDGLWIEKFKRENGYFEDESTIIYILDNCSSNVIPYCKGKVVYEVAVGYEEDEFDDEYDCANCVLDDCVRCGCGELESKDDDSENDNKDAYTITVKCHLDTDEAEKIISDMEKRVEHMNDMFAEMDAFRRIFRW